MNQILSSVTLRRFSIFILGFILYSYSISFDYAQDDAIVISDNMFTQKGLSGIQGILKYDTFYGFFKEAGKDQLVQGGRYRPATLVTFAIEQAIFGNNPHISHTLNALFYGLLCLVVFLFSKLCIRATRLKESSVIIAFIIALLFAAHPIHTEVVANIKGRDEIFVALFGLIGSYILLKKDSGLLSILGAYASLIVAFFSKENAIIFMVIIPLMVWFFGSRDLSRQKWIIRIVPVIVLGILYLFVRSRIISGGISAASMELMNNPFLKFDGTKMIPFSPGEKWATIIYNLGKYLQLMIFPFPLTSDYYPYHISIKLFSNPLVLLSLITHIGLIVAAIYGFFKKSPWAFGIIFYFGFLFLVSNVPFNIGTNISERFLFVPSYGLLFSIVYIVFDYFGKRSASPKVLRIPFISIVILFSIYTIYRSHVWKDDFTLLTTDVKTSSNSAKALHGAAGALSTKSSEISDPAKKNEMLKLSNQYLDKALKIYPFYKNAFLIRGNNYFYMKEYEKALENYNLLLDMDPDNMDALKNMGVVMRDAGRFYGETQNDLQKSRDYLLQSYNINNKDYETVRLLGVNYGISGDHVNAIRYFQEAVNLAQDNAMAWYNLGRAYQYKGDQEEAIAALEKAQKIDPDILNKMQK